MRTLRPFAFRFSVARVKLLRRDLALPLRLAVGAMFLVIVALTIAQVAARYLFDRPLIWSEEVAKLLLVWLVFLGAAAVTFDGRHLDVDVLFRAMPMPLRRVLRAVNLAAALFFLSAMVWFSIEVIEIESWANLGALGLSAAWVRLPAAVGGGLMIAFLLLRRATGGPSASPDSPDKPL
jgi:TRAP-type C4-dicarboxylate transport system permease small subunit